MSNEKKTAIYVGANGKVGQLTLPRLKEAGVETTAVVRNTDYEEVLRKLGAEHVEIRDITEQSAADWAELCAGYDVVIWSAGNGGRGGAEVTRAVDRDGELRLIEALAAMDKAPFYLTVSYLGWDTATSDEDPKVSSWAAYVDAKRAVGERLAEVSFDHTILAPGLLTLEPSRGARHVSGGEAVGGRATTARELVAQMITEHTTAPRQTSGTYAFIDA